MAGYATINKARELNIASKTRGSRRYAEGQNFEPAPSVNFA